MPAEYYDLSKRKRKQPIQIGGNNKVSSTNNISKEKPQKPNSTSILTDISKKWHKTHPIGKR